MKIAAILALAGMACIASAGLVDTRTGNGAGSVSVDGTLGANEYGSGNALSYAGGGGGFGGTLGGANSRLYVNSNASSLFLGVQVGGDLNDNIVVYFNTRNSGGFTSSTQMDDNSDPGRGRSSDPASGAGAVVNFPIAAQYSLVIGSFGAVLFELQGNGTQHAFKYFTDQFTGNGQNFREYALSLADLGNALGSRDYIDFFALYTSNSGFLSNETMPASPINASGNPGFAAGATINVENYNRFQIPAPGAASLLGLAGLAAARRRRA